MSPKGPNFIALETFDCERQPQQQVMGGRLSSLSAAVAMGQGYGMPTGKQFASPVGGFAAAKSEPDGDCNGVPEWLTKQKASVEVSISGAKPSQFGKRRQSQSLLGLEFRLKLVLNTLGLEGEAYQFALLGCSTASDVQFVKYEDLKGISRVKFRRLQAMCDSGDEDDDVDGDGEDSEEHCGEGDSVS